LFRPIQLSDTQWVTNTLTTINGGAFPTEIPLTTLFNATVGKPLVAGTQVTPAYLGQMDNGAQVFAITGDSSCSTLSVAEYLARNNRLPPGILVMQSSGEAVFYPTPCDSSDSYDFESLLKTAVRFPPGVLRVDSSGTVVFPERPVLSVTCPQSSTFTTSTPPTIHLESSPPLSQGVAIFGSPSSACGHLVEFTQGPFLTSVSPVPVVSIVGGSLGFFVSLSISEVGLAGSPSVSSILASASLFDLAPSQTAVGSQTVSGPTFNEPFSRPVPVQDSPEGENVTARQGITQLAPQVPKVLIEEPWVVLSFPAGIQHFFSTVPPRELIPTVQNMLGLLFDRVAVGEVAGALAHHDAENILSALSLFVAQQTPQRVTEILGFSSPRLNYRAPVSVRAVALAPFISARLMSDPRPGFRLGTSCFTSLFSPTTGQQRWSVPTPSRVQAVGSAESVSPTVPLQQALGGQRVEPLSDRLNPSQRAAREEGQSGGSRDSDHRRRQEEIWEEILAFFADERAVINRLAEQTSALVDLVDLLGGVFSGGSVIDLVLNLLADYRTYYRGNKREALSRPLGDMVPVLDFVEADLMEPGEAEINALDLIGLAVHLYVVRMMLSQNAASIQGDREGLEQFSRMGVDLLPKYWERLGVDPDEVRLSGDPDYWNQLAASGQYN